MEATIETRLEDKISNEKLTDIVMRHLEKNVPIEDLNREKNIASSFLQQHAQKKIHSYAILDMYNLADLHYN